MENFFHNFILSFITTFVALDAIGNLPFFVSLTEGLEPEERAQIANVSLLVATIITIGFMFGGKAIFRVMGISVSDFRIAGGILLLVLSTHMLISGKAMKVAPSDVAIFPLGSPLIAGPALLTTILVLAGTRGWFPTLVALLLNMLITWIIFRNASRIELLVTRQGAKAFSKVVEILLAAFAVNMIRMGIETAALQFIVNLPPG